MTTAIVDTTVPTTNPETTTTATTKIKTAHKKKTAAKEGDSTAAIIAAEATDQAGNVSPVLPVADTLPTLPIDQTAVDEAPADDVPVDDAPVIPPAADVHLTDMQRQVQYLTDLVAQGDEAIVAALAAGHVRVRTATARNTGTSTTSVPVVCAHCDKHFLGRPSQVECRVCTDYVKVHGTPRPLTGSTTGTATTTAAKTVTAGKKKGSKKVGTHRPH